MTLVHFGFFFLLIIHVTLASQPDSLATGDSVLEKIMDRLEKQDQRIKEQDQRNKEQDFQIETLVRQLKQNAELLTQPRVDNPVAFSAGLSETFDAGFDPHVVPYDFVFLNHGDAYSTTDYHFTAPVRGLYMFYVSCLTVEFCSVHLKVNDDITAGARAALPSSSSSGQGDANSIIVMLEEGDRVSVNTLDGYRNELYEPILFPEVTFNVFSGFLYAVL